MWIMPNEEAARLLERSHQSEDVEEDILEFCIRMKEMEIIIPLRIELINRVKKLSIATQFLMKVGYSERLYELLSDFGKTIYKLWRNEHMKETSILHSSSKITKKDDKIQF